MSSRLAITGLRSGLGREARIGSTTRSNSAQRTAPANRTSSGRTQMKEYIRPVKNDIKDSSKGVIEIMKSQALRNSNISNGHLMLGVQEHLNIS